MKEISAFDSTVKEWNFPFTIRLITADEGMEKAAFTIPAVSVCPPSELKEQKEVR